MEETNDIPLVSDFLMTKTLSQLEAEHGVKFRIAGHKVSLNYSQLEAIDTDLISQECRGLILRRSDGAAIKPEIPLGDTVVLARPFDRFFNLGQNAAAEVDFSHPNTRFFEKLDGTMCILYFDDGDEQWHVATRSISEANLFIDGFKSFTFRTLFERAVLDTTSEEFAVWTRQLDPGITMIFELTTPVNRIVVPYETYRITLLGLRINSSGQELDPVVFAPTIDVPCAPIFRFGHIDEMVDFVSSRDPQKYEGIVVCDPQYRRVKVKSAGYLALNRIRDSVVNSPRALLELVLLEKLDDLAGLLLDKYLKHAHEMQENLRIKFRMHEATYNECLNEADSVTNRMDERGHRKAFALAINTRGGWMAPLMEQYVGRCSGLRDWIEQKRQVNGGWSTSFLGTLMKAIQ